MTMTAETDLPTRSAPLAHGAAALAAAPPLIEGSLAVVAQRAPAREEAA
jgi:hypothetical protein